MSGLDHTDIAILRILQEDASLTTKQIAARVHLSPTPVYERIRRLQDQGYIRGYVAVLDAEKLDCSFIAFCYIKMKQHTFENARRLMDAVQTMDEAGECNNRSGDDELHLKHYPASMKEYQQFVLRILGELDCIGGLNSSFVMGEVKNTHAVPVR